MTWTVKCIKTLIVVATCSLSDKVFDNATDDLEMIAVSRSSMSLLLQKKAVRISVEPFEQETKPLTKI